MNHLHMSTPLPTNVALQPAAASEGPTTVTFERKLQ